MTLSIEVADVAYAAEILDFLRGMHAEIGQAPLDDEKAWTTIAQVCEGGAAFVVRDGGRIVASLGITEFDLWYAKGTMLGEIWLYVAPAYRGAGEAIGLLMAEAKALAESVGKPVFLDHYRPPRRGAGLAVVADRVGFVPVSRILELSAGGH